MIRIRLHRVYYPVTTLGPGRRLGIWVQGCTRGCRNCLSPEMQPLTRETVPVEEILKQIPPDLQPDGLTISGGEPFDQPKAVDVVVRWFLQHHTDDVLVYTGYTLEELRARRDPDTAALLSHIAALADGPYREEQNFGTGQMGSANQRLYIWRYAERYRNFTTMPRTLQAVQEENRVLFIGIPPKEA